MNILYFGGQKSGKTNAAIKHALSLTESKPFYVATYDASYSDDEMMERIDLHIEQRQRRFITIEETKDLPAAISFNGTYVIDCLSMWILNNIDNSQACLIEQIDKLMDKDSNFVFVLNDVGEGIIPLEKETRRFVDLTGIIGQHVASRCDEVYRVSLGLKHQLK